MHLEEVANEAPIRAAQPKSPNPPVRLVYDNLNGRKDPLSRPVTCRRSVFRVWLAVLCRNGGSRLPGLSRDLYFVSCVNLKSSVIVSAPRTW